MLKMIFQINIAQYNIAKVDIASRQSFFMMGKVALLFYYI